MTQASMQYRTNSKPLSIRALVVLLRSPQSQRAIRDLLDEPESGALAGRADPTWPTDTTPRGGRSSSRGGGGGSGVGGMHSSTALGGVPEPPGRRKAALPQQRPRPVTSPAVASASASSANDPGRFTSPPHPGRPRSQDGPWRDHQQQQQRQLLQQQSHQQLQQRPPSGSYGRDDPAAVTSGPAPPAEVKRLSSIAQRIAPSQPKQQQRQKLSPLSPTQQQQQRDSSLSPSSLSRKSPQHPPARRPTTPPPLLPLLSPALLLSAGSVHSGIAAAAMSSAGVSAADAAAAAAAIAWGLGGGGSSGSGLRNQALMEADRSSPGGDGSFPLKPSTAPSPAAGSRGGRFSAGRPSSSPASAAALTSSFYGHHQVGVTDHNSL